MPADFNGIYDLNRKRDGGRVDKGALEARLRDYADQWIPREFPQGWRSDSGDAWCVGDITGKRPAGNGSCRINLRGDHAGDWYDFSQQRGGQVFSTIKERFRLGSGEVFREAERILAECGVDVARATEQPRPPRPAKPSNAEDHIGEAKYWYINAEPLTPDSLSVRYLNRRAAPPPLDSWALRHHPAVTRWVDGARTTQPALIALFQRPSDNLAAAVHRIYLKPDGSWHDGKMMLGPVKGALVMISPPANGLLGIAEGVETSLAASSLFNGVPGWAAGSDGGLKNFAAWITTNPGWAWSVGIRRLLIWADRKRAGETAGHELLNACRKANIDAQLWLPRGGDDFADDGVRGLLPGAPEATTRDTEVLVQREPGEIEDD